MLNGTLMAVPACLETCIVVGIYEVTSQVDPDLYGTIYHLVNPRRRRGQKRRRIAVPPRSAGKVWSGRVCGRWEGLLLAALRSAKLFSS